MTDNYRKNLPAFVGQLGPAAEARARIGHAVTIRNPFRALVHSIGNDSAVSALESQTRLAHALTLCIDQHTKAVDAMDKLHTSIDNFQANRLGLARPEIQERLEEEMHQRTVARKRREKELYEAQEQALEAKHRLEARAQFKEQKFAAGAARFNQKIAERQVGEAVARASMQEEILEPEGRQQHGSKSASKAQTLALLIDELEKEIDEAEAAGRPTEELRTERDSLNALLRRELLRSGGE
jgi:hypothetical protein